MPEHVLVAAFVSAAAGFAALSALALQMARRHRERFERTVDRSLRGAFLFVAVLSLWAREAWRLWRSPQLAAGVRALALVFLACAANYLVNGMFHDVAIIPVVNMVLFFLAGTTVGLAREAEKDQPKNEKRAIRPGRPLSG